MKTVHFRVDGKNHFGRIVDDHSDSRKVESFGILGEQLPATTSQLISKWNNLDLPSHALDVFEYDAVSLLPPIDDCQKVICVGRNYAEHAAEMDSNVGELPVIFNKFPSTIIGPGEEIQLPRISQQVDFEAELVVVIGRKCKDVSEADAGECIFGYCCGNDVSARDWQKGRPGGQWLLGKTFDTFAPIGPWLVTRDRVQANQLDIRLRLNGETMQLSNTKHLIFGIEFLVAHISKFCTLMPGDLIFTGTPSGVGAARTPPIFLKAGDVVEVEIDGLGVLSNPVTDGG